MSRRPVLVFLTHCHQDHSQEAGLELPAGIEIKRFAHQAGVEALKHRDRNLTVAYLYPWNPEICTARFEGILFASSPASEPPALEFADGGRIELHTEPIAMPDGTTLQRQWLSLGAGNRLEIYHTPGHSPCSISLRVGSLLMLGDLPFAANPGVCGLDGWNHADLLQTLHKVDWLLDTPVITVCCPGHGYCVSAQSMREKLRLMEAEASNLTDVPLMDAERVSALKIYVDELLEETAALFTIFSGRLYTVSYYLSLLRGGQRGKPGSGDPGYRPDRPHPLRLSPHRGSVQHQRHARMDRGAQRRSGRQVTAKGPVRRACSATPGFFSR